MAVTIPEVRLDPAALEAAIGPMTHASDVVAAQADTVARTWLGLDGVYSAEEAATLFTALDPVRTAAELHQHRVAAVGAALHDFVAVAGPIVRQLEDLRAQAATAPPEDEPRILQQSQSLLAALQEADRSSGAAVRSALDRSDPATDRLDRWIEGRKGAALLEAGDYWVGRHLLDSSLERELVEHFTSGTAAPYVFTREQLAALAADPTVLRAAEAARRGESTRDVTLEGGGHGRQVDVDFSTPVPGRTGVNPYDGSLGKASLFFDDSGRFVGMSDAYDFTNDNPAVDRVNAVGATYGARPFHVRAGVVEQQPVEQFLPKEPDRGEAAARLAARYRGEDPGRVPLTPRPR